MVHSVIVLCHRMTVIVVRFVSCDQELTVVQEHGHYRSLNVIAAIWINVCYCTIHVPTLNVLVIVHPCKMECCGTVGVPE